MAKYDLASFAYKSMSRYVSSKESVQKSSNIKTAAAADWKFNNLDAINILPGKISIALPAVRTRTVSRMLQKIARKLAEATFECDHSSMSSDLTGPCLMSTAARSDLWGHSRVKWSTSSRYISEKISHKHQYTWKTREELNFGESSIISLISVQIYIQELHDRINLV